MEEIERGWRERTTVRRFVFTIFLDPMTRSILCVTNRLVSWSLKLLFIGHEQYRWQGYAINMYFYMYISMYVCKYVCIVNGPPMANGLPFC